MPKPGRAYPPEVAKFIRDHVKGISTKELVEMVNEKFGTEFTVSKMHNFKCNHNLKSGIDGRFKKGHMPHNKGQKGIMYKGSEKGWFKKGHVSENKRPIGSERVESKNGYIMIKVAEPNKWRLKHNVIWEEHNGLIPKGNVVIFLDGDKTNCNIDNLVCITQEENLIMNKRGLRYSEAELTKTGTLIAKVVVAERKASEKK